MNIEIQEQKRLMQNAIDILNRMDEVIRIWGRIDPDRARLEYTSGGAEYASVMAKLVRTCLYAAGLDPENIHIEESKLSSINVF